MTEPTVGFVGLGQMGSLMASRLADWPGGLIGYDVRPVAALSLEGSGARAAASLGELAAAADIISVMVLDDAQVRSVVGEMTPHLRRGSIVAVHSTVHPATAADVASGLVVRGIDVLDAPVSGGAVGAREGRLAVMVGGNRASYERCKPVFRRWAELVVHVGDVGAGTRAKLARNLVSFVGFCAAAEAQRLAEASGVDLGKLGAVVRHTDAITGGAGSIMVRHTTAALSRQDGLYDVFAHTRDLGEKDLSLALELGAEIGVDLPFTRLARQRLAAGLGLPDAPGPDSEEA